MSAKSKSSAARAAGGGKGPQLRAEVISQPSVPSNAPQGRKMTIPSGPPSHHEWVQALIDPFNSEGVRLPDEFNGGSVPESLEHEITVSSDAAGYLAVSFNPTLGTGYRNTYTITGGVLGTGPAAVSHPDQAQFTANYASIRHLIMGVQVTYIGADQTASGRIGLVNFFKGTEYDLVNIADIFDDTKCTGRAQDGYVCVARPNQRPQFNPTITHLDGRNDIGTVLLVATGLPPSTVCFSVRVVLLVEGIPLRGSVLKRSVESEPSDPHAMTIGANVGSHLLHGKPNTEVGRRQLVSEGKGMADAAWQMLVAASPALGIPSGVTSMLPSIYNTARNAIRAFRRRND